MERIGRRPNNLSYLVIIYIIFLIFGYWNFIPAIPYTHAPYNYGLLLLVVLLAYVPSLWLAPVSYKPSVFVLWVLYIVVIIPSIVIPYLSLSMSFLQLLQYNFFLLLCFFILTRTKNARPIKMNYLLFSNTGFYIVFFTIYGLLTFSMIQQFGFNFQFVAISDVYDLRATYREQLGESSSLGMRWLLYIFNPFLIVVGYLYRQRRWMLFLGFFGEFMIYSTAGFKTALFIGFIIVLIIFLAEKFNFLLRLPKLILICVVSLLLIAFIGDTIFFQDFNSNYNILTSLTLRRNFVVPGFLSGQYFSFFYENPKAYMASHKFFGFFVDYQSPYSQPIQYIIGQRTFGREFANANVNLWAESYANYGYIGMVITSCVLYVYLVICDSLSQNLDLKLTFPLMIGPTVFFSNSSLLTALIGHGAIWVVIILFLYQSLIRSNEKKSS